RRLARAGIAIERRQVDPTAEIRENASDALIFACGAWLANLFPDLPNDPIVVRKDLDPVTAKKLQEVLLAITAEQAKSMMPLHYTGWIAATHKSYRLIEDAGIAVGKLHVKTD
ncbi:MAG: hypothetical protein DI543_25800, partial [Bradyrhizobium icense]